MLGCVSSPSLCCCYNESISSGVSYAGMIWSSSGHFRWHNHFPKARKSEQRCSLETGFFLCDDSVKLWNRCIDGHTVVLCWFVWVFFLASLNAFPCKSGSWWVCFSVQSFMNFNNCNLAPQHPTFTSLSLLTFMVSSRLLLTLVSWWSWCSSDYPAGSLQSVLKKNAGFL